MTPLPFKRWRSFVVASAFLCGIAPASRAILLFGDEAANADNLLAPPNGAPWQYVARLDLNGVPDASAVYLGNGFLITANHVNLPTSASLNGNVYAIDSSYPARQIDGADIKLLRILGEPGLAPLILIGANDNDLSKSATLIGWGLGKGSDVPGQGWNWGDESTRAEQWGLNSTQPLYTTSVGQQYLVTSFDRFGGSGDDEAATTLGDSGSALFEKFGNTWKLAGITSAVETFGQSLYDHDPVMLLDQPDHNYFVPVKQHRATILAAIAVPEPAAAALFACGALFLGARRRRAAVA